MLVPYAFTALVWVVPISQCFYKWDMLEILKRYVLCINPSQLWFLWMLFWVFVIAWPLWKWLSGSVYIGSALSLVLYCVGIAGAKVIPNVYCIWTAFQYMPFFYVGIRIRLKQEEKENLWIQKVPILCWVLVDILIFVLNLMVEEEKLHFPCLGVITGFTSHIIGAVMAFSVLQNIADRVNWRKNKRVVALTKYSMSMYLFHEQLIYFAISLFNGKINPYVNAGLNFIVAVVGTLIISCSLMQFKITRFLIGEK